MVVVNTRVSLKVPGTDVNARLGTNWEQMDILVKVRHTKKTTAPQIESVRVFSY